MYYYHYHMEMDRWTVDAFSKIINHLGLKLPTPLVLMVLERKINRTEAYLCNENEELNHPSTLPCD